MIRNLKLSAKPFYLIRKQYMFFLRVIQDRQTNYSPHQMRALNRFVQAKTA